MNRPGNWYSAGIVLVATIVAAVPRPTYAAEQLPASVVADLKEVGDTCRDVGGTPQTSNAVKKADLNGDGYDDYLLNVGAVECDGAVSIYGDREKTVTVYIGDTEGGAAQAFSDSVFGAKIEGSGSAAKLWLTVSGAQCGKPPAANFASESFCDRSVMWNATAKKLEYAPVETVRMIE